MGRPRVILPDCSHMFLTPVRFVVNPDMQHQRPFAGLQEDRDREPLDAVGCLDPVPIPPAFLVVLDIIIDHKYVAPAHLFEKPEPGEITRLEDTDHHELFYFPLIIGNTSFRIMDIQTFNLLLPTPFSIIDDFPVVVFPRAVFPIRTIPAKLQIIAFLGQVLLPVMFKIIIVPDLFYGFFVHISHIGSRGNVKTTHHHLAP